MSFKMSLCKIAFKDAICDKSLMERTTEERSNAPGQD